MEEILYVGFEELFLCIARVLG